MNKFLFKVTNQSVNNQLMGVAIITLILTRLQLHNAFIQTNKNILNPFAPNAPFLYPLKTSENVTFSDVFRGYRKGA